MYTNSTKLTEGLRKTYRSLDRYFEDRRASAEKRRTKLEEDRNFLAGKENLVSEINQDPDDPLRKSRPGTARSEAGPRTSTPGTLGGGWSSRGALRRPSSGRPPKARGAGSSGEDGEEYGEGSTSGLLTGGRRGSRSKSGGHEFVERMLAARKERVEKERSLELRSEHTVAPKYTGRITKAIPFQSRTDRRGASAVNAAS